MCLALFYRVFVCVCVCESMKNLPPSTLSPFSQLYSFTLIFFPSFEAHTVLVSLFLMANPSHSPAITDLGEQSSFSPRAVCSPNLFVRSAHP